MSKVGLSKSKLLAWRQCPKRLWLENHRRDVLNISHAVEKRLLEGYDVHAVAHSLYLDGQLVSLEQGWEQAMDVTQVWLQQTQPPPLFEATFAHEGIGVRVDVLQSDATHYHVTEIKSSTQVKPHHVEDCAVQAWVLQQVLAKPITVNLALLDTQFVYQGNAQYQGLFYHVPIDNLLNPLLEKIPVWIQAARAVLQQPHEPSIAMGDQCYTPFSCPFQSHCLQGLAHNSTPEFSLSTLHSLHKNKRREWEKMGVQDARFVPSEWLSTTQQRIQRIIQNGQAELLSEAKAHLDSLAYPRYYLDFETTTFAVPRWANTKPYAKLLFQWSCHIETEAGVLQHRAFLDTSGNDMRRDFALTLLQALGQTGVIFVYDQTFEKARLNELSELFPELALDLDYIKQRIVDLLPIAQANYYHPAMQGSWSIKAILPTIAPDLDYNTLSVCNGLEAQDAYAEIIHPRTPPNRKDELIQGLEAYCALDTLAMVRLAWFLSQASPQTSLQVHPHTTDN